MKIFVTSDTHFFHKNILKLCPNTRPWGNVDEMNEALVTNWNETVRPFDIVYHLGDVSIGSKTKAAELLARLNGKVRLIMGNHDKDFAYYDQKGQFKLRPFGQQMIDDGVFEYIQPYAEIQHDHKTVTMFHYAPKTWNKSFHGSYALFGHSHGAILGEGRSMDVGIDSSDMPSNGRPFLLDDVLAFLKNRFYTM